MPEFVRVWGNNGIREVPVIQGVQEVLGSRAVTGSTGAQVIAQIGIPFLIMPGDGSANGCQFTGTGGAFTLTAAIIANIWPSLAGCYAYFSANFGGSSLPAGWYWTEFSSDTAGIVYAETYTSGKVKSPATKTAITPNLSGWVTGTTVEITGPNGFVLPGTALGKNGVLELFLSQAGSTTGTKSYRMQLDGTNVFQNGGTASPVGDSLHTATCTDSVSEKQLGRTSAISFVSLGSATTGFSAANRVSIDTSIDRTVSLSLQQSTNVSTPVLMRFSLKATYGE
jgi:hypothetical protein